MKLHLLLLSLVLLFSWTACESADEAPEQLCSDDIMCPTSIAYIEVLLSDQSGQPLILDSHYSKNMDTGEIYTWEAVEFPNWKGNYVILNDLYKHKLNRTGTSIEFTGILNGQEVVKEIFVIGYNCCSITLLEGDLKIMVNVD